MTYARTVLDGTVEKFSAHCESMKENDGFVEYEGKESYICGTCGMKSILLFDDALERQFACAHCGEKLEFLDEGKKKALFNRE